MNGYQEQKILKNVLNAKQGIGCKVRTWTMNKPKKNKRIKCACGCGKHRWKYDKRGRANRFIYNHYSNTLKVNRKNRLIKCACGCGRTLWKYDKVGRKRKFIHGHWINVNQISFRKHPQKKVKCACGCGKYRLKYDTHGEERRYIFNHQNKRKKIKNKRIKCKCGCGRTLWKYDKWKTKRKYILGHHQKINKKNKQIKCFCGCGKYLWKYDNRGIKRKWINGHCPIGKRASEETRRKLSEAHSGEKCFFWNGGTSFEPYGIEFSKRLRREIRDRDNHHCQFCKEKENGKRHPIHHIDYNKKNNKPKNLITLCKSCHSKTNFNREFWIAFFKKKMRKK